MKEMKDCLTVIFPGMSYTVKAPLLRYAQKIAKAAGSEVLGIEYGFRRRGESHTPSTFELAVTETMDILRGNEIEKYRRVVFISKGLGTLLAGEVTKRLDSAVISSLFLTPVKDTVPYMLRRPCTVLYGTADEHFSENDMPNSPGIKAYKFDRANHSLETADWRTSLDTLKKVCEIYEDFLSAK